VGRGQFDEYSVQGGAGLGRQVALDRAHAVDVLAADDDAALSGAVDVGEVSVGVEAVGELVGQLGQLVGTVLACRLGQIGSGITPTLVTEAAVGRIEAPSAGRVA
jgi:hypothetical protein